MKAMTSTKKSFHPEFKSSEEAKSWQVDFTQKAKTSEHAIIRLDDI